MVVLTLALLGSGGCQGTGVQRPSTAQRQIEPWEWSYLDQVHEQVRRAWYVPEWVKHRKTEIRVGLRVARDGRILSTTFERRSGVADLDASVEKALERAREQGLPPLPPEYVGDTLEFGLIFDPSRS